MRYSFHTGFCASTDCVRCIKVRLAVRTRALACAALVHHSRVVVCAFHAHRTTLILHAPTTDSTTVSSRSFPQHSSHCGPAASAPAPTEISRRGLASSSLAQPPPPPPASARMHAALQSRVRTRPNATAHSCSAATHARTDRDARIHAPTRTCAHNRHTRSPALTHAVAHAHADFAMDIVLELDPTHAAFDAPRTYMARHSSLQVRVATKTAAQRCSWSS